MSEQRERIAPTAGNRVAARPCFDGIPFDEEHTAICSVCGGYFTVTTKLHQKAVACTGCMLRTLRPFDYTERGGVAG